MQTPEPPPLPVSVVIPTRNEANNVDALLKRLPPVEHIIFVDDSDDDTPDRAHRHRDRRPITVLHRTLNERTGGLATAVVAGIGVVRSPYWCVMDADLQHPPELVTDLYNLAQRDDLDVVVASRRNWDSINEGLSPIRRLVSAGLGAVAFALFRRDLHGVLDPLSGFFLVRADAVAHARLKPTGFKILLELLVTHPHVRVAEAPFNFGDRHADRSKGSAVEAARYLRHVARLWWRRRHNIAAWSRTPRSSNQGR